MELQRRGRNWVKRIAACLLAGALLTACGDGPGDNSVPTAGVVPPPPTQPGKEATASLTRSTGQGITGAVASTPTPNALPTLTGQQYAYVADAADGWRFAESFHFVYDESATNGSISAGDLTTTGLWASKLRVVRIQFTVRYGDKDRPPSQLLWISPTLWQKTEDQWQAVPSGQLEQTLLTNIQRELFNGQIVVDSLIKDRQLTRGGSENINGQECDYYVADYNYNGDKNVPIKDEIWISKDTGEIVRINMHGPYSIGIITISKMNEPVTIDPPP